MRYRRFTNDSLVADDSAILGWPLNISIAMMILMLSIPLVYGGMRTYNVNAAVSEVEAQTSLLFQVAEVVYLSEENGPAAEMPVTLAFSNRPMADLEWVRIGADISGSNSGKSFYIDYFLSGSMHFVLKDGVSIPLMADNNAGGEQGEMMLAPGLHKLRLVLVVATNDASETLPACSDAAGTDSRFVCLQEVP